MYLTDKDLIKVLRRLSAALKEKGFIVVRENIFTRHVKVDDKKGAIDRSKVYLEKIFKEAGLSIEDYEPSVPRMSSDKYGLWILKPMKSNINVAKDVMVEQSDHTQNLHNTISGDISLGGGGGQTPKQEKISETKFFSDLISGNMKAKDGVKTFLSSSGFAMFDNFKPVEMEAILKGLLLEDEKSYKANLLEFFKECSTYIHNTNEKRAAAFLLVVALSHLVTLRGEKDSADLAVKLKNQW